MAYSQPLSNYLGTATTPYQTPVKNTTSEYIQDPNNRYASIPNPNYNKPIPIKPTTVTGIGAGVGIKAGGGTGVSAVLPVIDQATSEALHFLGYSDSQINSMSEGDRANWAMVGTYMKKQYDLGVQQTKIDAQTFNDAYAKALADPLIASKYVDLATTTSKDFINNLSQISLNAQLTGQQQAMTMTQEQKQLQENEAEAGRAYSGFRQQAQGRLSTSQQGIITSTKSQIAQQLRTAGSAVEKLYGSGYAGLSTANTQYINPLTGQTETIVYEPYGGLAGTVEQAKEADILARQQEIYKTLKSPTATK